MEELGAEGARGSLGRLGLVMNSRHMARLRFSLDRGEQSSCVCGRDLSWRYLRPQCREPRLLGRLSSNWVDVLSFKADGWKGARVLDQP